MNDNHLWPFWLLAVVLHGVVAAYYLGTLQHKPIELTGEGGTGIEVGLDQAAYQALMQQQAKAKQQAKKARATKQVKKQALKPIKPKQALTKKPTTTPKKVAKKPVIKQIVKKAPANTSTESIVKQPAKQQVAMLAPAQTTLTASQITQTDAVSVNDDQNSAAATEALSNTSANTVQTNNAPAKAMGNPAPLVMNDATKRYIRKLMRHLSQFKEYPSALKKAHIEGTPIIRFTFNQAGEVLETTIKKRSNNQALDQAAMEVFKKANPLPPIPQALKRDTLTMSLPIKFNLIND